MTSEPPKSDSTAAATTAATATPAAADTSISEDAPGELTAVVDELLDSLSTKFASVSSEIFEKIEAMSKRLDAMETSLQQGSGPTTK
ncbi:hypothetical protein Q9L58_006034 [Maublancomyces gigas]|uniref:Heat shock factor binding protein 1 n=1 Tax=Discina gigas TaxID=1032678 RepID=A0ABR3GGU1_9PEZI